MFPKRLSLALLLLPWLVHAITATRSIHFDSRQPSQCRVRVDIEGRPQDFPRVFLLVESVASDASICDASWNGSPFPANLEVDREGVPTGHGRWLFGYGEGNPASTSGRLEYTLLFPASFSVKARATIDGKILTSDNETIHVGGTRELHKVKGLERILGREGLLTFAPGWNLLSLPCPLNGEALKETRVASWYGLDEGAGAYLRLDGPPSPDGAGARAVWAYRAAPDTFSLPLSWGEADGDGGAAAKSLPRGWVLKSVEESVAGGRRERWHWHGSHYRPGVRETEDGAVWERRGEAEEGQVQ